MNVYSIFPKFPIQLYNHYLQQYSTNIFYSGLVKDKFQPPISIVKWNTEFDLSEKKNWESIIFNKIKDVKDIFLAEFNYKLLNNLLSNNLLFSKWNRNITNKCKSCISQIKYAKQLFFYCINVQNIWKVASSCLNFDISWKHIVVGFSYCL